MHTTNAILIPFHLAVFCVNSASLHMSLITCYDHQIALETDRHKDAIALYVQIGHHDVITVLQSNRIAFTSSVNRTVSNNLYIGVHVHHLKCKVDASVTRQGVLVTCSAHYNVLVLMLVTTCIAMQHFTIWLHKQVGSSAHISQSLLHSQAKTPQTTHVNLLYSA